MLDHEVDHGAAAVRPSVQVQSDAVRRHLDEPRRLGDDRFRAFGAGVEHVGWIAGSDSKINVPIYNLLYNFIYNLLQFCLDLFTRCTPSRRSGISSRKADSPKCTSARLS